MRTRFILKLAAAAAALTLTACASTGGQGRSPNEPPAEAGVWFVEPKDGAVLDQTFKMKFGVKGMTVEPAGEQNKGKGHHHVLINLDSKPAGQIIPFDAQHTHYGKGQTEAEMKLPPGKYKLTMQFADGFHLSYGPTMAATITVTVK